MLIVPRIREGHVLIGRGSVLNENGSIAWEEDWQLNALHDSGEKSLLDVYLKGQANVTKYLGLLNDGTVNKTDSTMSEVTEMTTPGTSGYNRQQILTTDWTDDGVQGSGYRFTAAEKTFGPITGSAKTATHASLSTTSTGAGILILTLALSATTVISVNQSFKYVIRWLAE